MDIVKADSLASDSPTKVYEGRAKSTGRCNVIVEVFDEILEAMFTDYAAVNGRSLKWAVPSDANC